MKSQYSTVNQSTDIRGQKNLPRTTGLGIISNFIFEKSFIGDGI